MACAVCGAACVGIGKAAGKRGASALLVFQIGRLAGYAVLGAIAAASMQTLAWYVDWHHDVLLRRLR